jgi:hypothetical protein
MFTVGGCPALQLRLRVVIEDVVTEMDPAEVAVIMVPVGSIR